MKLTFQNFLWFHRNFLNMLLVPLRHENDSPHGLTTPGRCDGHQLQTHRDSIGFHTSPCAKGDLGAGNSTIFELSPRELGKIMKISNLTSIFFRWDSTTQEIMVCELLLFTLGLLFLMWIIAKMIFIFRLGCCPLPKGWIESIEGCWFENVWTWDEWPRRCHVVHQGKACKKKNCERKTHLKKPPDFFMRV